MFRVILAILAIWMMSGCSDVSPKRMNDTFRSVPISKAKIYQSGKHKDSCAICGMNLPKFYKTNHLATLKDGSKRQYCSLHCVVYDNEFNKTDLLNLKVVDAKTLKLVPALKAYYVVGSSKPATMSRVSKYAFAKKSDAIAFAKQNGGKVMKFYDAYAEATKDFSKRRR